MTKQTCLDVTLEGETSVTKNSNLKNQKLKIKINGRRNSHDVTAFLKSNFKYLYVVRFPHPSLGSFVRGKPEKLRCFLPHVKKLRTSKLLRTGRRNSRTKETKLLTSKTKLAPCGASHWGGKQLRPGAIFQW